MINKYIILSLLSVTLSSFSQILLKKGTMTERTSFIREYLNAHVIFGYLLMLAATLLTVLSYKGMQFKSVAVISSLGYVLVMLLSTVFLKERITAKKTFGIILIMIGIAVFYA